MANKVADFEAWSLNIEKEATSRTNLLLRNYSDVKFCVRCNQMFFVAEELGRWNCKEHTMLREMMTSGPYECCGYDPDEKSTRYKTIDSTNARGCTPCDHSENKKLLTVNDCLALTPELQKVISTHKFNEDSLLSLGDMHYIMRLKI